MEYWRGLNFRSSVFDVLCWKLRNTGTSMEQRRKRTERFSLAAPRATSYFLLFRLSRSRFHEKFKLFYYLFWSFSLVPAFAEWSSKIVIAKGENLRSELIRNWREKTSAKNKCEVIQKVNFLSFFFFHLASQKEHWKYFSAQGRNNFKPQSLIGFKSLYNKSAW